MPTDAREHCALVFGATGYTGRAVVAELRERNVDTVAHIRPASGSGAARRAEFEELGARVATAPWDQQAMVDLIAKAQPTLVFALLGTTRSRGKTTGDTYETVDYGLSKLALDAVVQAAPAACFVYLSSMGAGPSARGAYLQVRARMEAHIQEANCPYLIARPSFITGPDRDEFRPGERFAAWVGDAGLAVASALGAKATRAKYGSTTSSDLASALVLQALHGPYNRVLGGADLRA